MLAYVLRALVLKKSFTQPFAPWTESFVAYLEQGITYLEFHAATISIL